MKIKRPEEKPVIPWGVTPRVPLADFSDSDVIEVDAETGELLKSYGYKEVKRRKKED